LSFDVLRSAVGDQVSTTQIAGYRFQVAGFRFRGKIRFNIDLLFMIGALWLRFASGFEFFASDLNFIWFLSFVS
jgi:hypothetical protein